MVWIGFIWLRMGSLSTVMSSDCQGHSEPHDSNPDSRRTLVQLYAYAGSIPDEVIGFFNLRNPPSRTMALVSTQPLTEMSTRNLHGGTGRPV
jgi:hypothetical protein